MESLLADLRYAVRMLVKRPAFTLVAVLSLALGIGANTTIFSVVNALLLRSVPVADPSRLAAIYARDAQNPAMLAAPLSHLNWKDYREQARSFSGILGYDWAPMSFAKGGAEATLVVGQLVSENYFDLLGIRAARGRVFMGEEATKPGAHPVAVVSHHFWRQQLGGDPGVVGRTITLNGSAFTVIGVAPESFTGTDTGVQPELWVPMAMNRQIKRDPELNWYETRRGLFVNAIGRLRPGVSLAAAQSEMTAIARRLEQEAMQSEQLAQQVLAMRKLANPSWRDITRTLAQMDALMQQGQALAYNLNSIDAAFQQTFPGTQVYRNYPTDAQTQSARTLATLRGALDAANERLLAQNARFDGRLLQRRPQAGGDCFGANKLRRIATSCARATLWRLPRSTRAGRPAFHVRSCIG